MTINPPASSSASTMNNDDDDNNNNRHDISIHTIIHTPDPILHTYHSLITSATKLTAAFISHSPILPYFLPTCLVTEHGPSSLAPFLGRQICIGEYLDVLGTYCTYRNVVFSEFCADPMLCEVVVKAKGVFEWIETGKEWEEVFVWRLGMRKSFGGGGGGGDGGGGVLEEMAKDEDEDEGEAEWKVWRWQVWADTASLMLAKKVKGMINDAKSED